MEPLIDARSGFWALVILPEYLQSEMVHATVKLAGSGDVSVAVCNNPELGHILQQIEEDERYQTAGKINLRQPLNCLELAGFLEWMHPTKDPILLLDFLGVFQDRTLTLKARQAVLKNCIKQLEILSFRSRVVVSVSPIEDPNSDVQSLMEILQQSAPDVRTEIPIYL